jgi:hypothetical protein
LHCGSLQTGLNMEKPAWISSASPSGQHESMAQLFKHTLKLAG